MRPQGTHTFLFADIERSTSLLRRLGSESYATLLEREAEILGDACAAHGGRLVDREGDGCMFVFSSAIAAILGAARAQGAIDEERFPEPVRVRMGVHTGEAIMVGDRFVGVAVHRAARICAAADGGQVLVSSTTREIVADAIPEGLELDELGTRRLRDLEGVERLFALRGEPSASETHPIAVAAVPPGSVASHAIDQSARDRVAAFLRELCLGGRLPLEQFSLRLQALEEARTEDDLAAALREIPVAADPPRLAKRRAWLVTLFGSEQRTGRWRVPERMICFSVIGSPDLDFRQAVVSGDEMRITSFALVGSLTALVPPAVDVELGGFSLVGGNDLETTPGVTTGGHGGLRLRLRCFSLFGGAEIRRTRASEEAPAGTEFA